MVVEKISVSACEKLIDVATAHCQLPQAVAAQTQGPPQTNFDALATSFAALGNALTFGGILIAIIGLIAALGWGFLVKRWAQETARDHAKALVEDYLNNMVPSMIADYMKMASDASLNGEVDDACAADKIGKEAG